MSILVPLDRSSVGRTALPEAARLATALGRPLLLVSVADAEIIQGIAEFAEKEHADPADVLEADLRSAASSLGDVETDTELIPGQDAADAIVTRADRGDVDMIVIATHGRTGMARWRLGSVAERVVRAATVPVLVVPAPWRRTETADARRQPAAVR